LIIIDDSFKNIIKQFINITGSVKPAPKWSFGPWISAHRWNSEKVVYDVMDKLALNNIPVTVLVLEQWSDEATFYIFNKAKYKNKEVLNYEDYDFSDSPWPDPKGMISDLHKQGIHLLLWQAPVVKKIPSDEEFNQRHYDESIMVSSNNLAVKLKNGEDYRIPDGNWFDGSMIPDFTNPKTIKWWFNNRQYLLDIGVDGFKTDGGEFIHSDQVINYSREEYNSLKNNYPLEYAVAYSKFVKKNRIVFNRAGYLSQQAYSMIWAGDQKSSFSELKAIYNAGINASICGQIYWGFDIGGFSGELPSVELYYRANQLALFSPIMQVHSEPVGGQFSINDPTREFNNERTIWNMAKSYNSVDLNKDISAYYRLRMNILPYIYSENLKALNNKTTIMKHMNIDYNGEFPLTQYIFGDLIVSVILDEEINQANVIFPKNEVYYNIFTNITYQGNSVIDLAEIKDICVFAKEGTALVTKVANLYPDKIDSYLEYSSLYFRLYGKKGEYKFIDENSDFIIKWNNKSFRIEGHYNFHINVEYIF
jgi:alpha-D-xyloside xylohydrolase